AVLEYLPGSQLPGLCVYADLLLRFCLATLAACLPKAVLVFLGKWAIVRFFLAATAAFLMLRRAAARCFSLGIIYSPCNTQCRLKYCTARSCALAFSSDENVPRLRRFPVLGFFLREYSRYSPDFSFRIMSGNTPIYGQ
ncbi:MAG TPA: hypothetical protein VFB79_12390, partial [Candidatus Angelobacter sp.]|nr:hypothetical protein [Candidatus Angelobacter sp.]